MVNSLYMNFQKNGPLFFSETTQYKIVIVHFHKCGKLSKIRKTVLLH